MLLDLVVALPGGVHRGHLALHQPDQLKHYVRNMRPVLISSSEVGSRVEQHRNVVEAAKAAEVGLIAYTSIIRADTARMTLAAEHRATEEIIRESGLPYVLLRNSWYFENYTANLAQMLQHREVLGSAGHGRVSAATRADYAAAAAAVLTGANHGNAVYELGGDESFTLAELATEITRQTGTGITYHDLPVEEYTRVLIGRPTTTLTEALEVAIRA